MDGFRAGTFKFERNNNFTTDIEKLKSEIAKAYDQKMEIERHKYNYGQYNSMKLDHIKQELRKRKPDIQYIKTFVPIFPFVYQTLDNG